LKSCYTGDRTKAKVDCRHTPSISFCINARTVSLKPIFTILRNVVIISN
jgi:hypothetical protein